MNNYRDHIPSGQDILDFIEASIKVFFFVSVLIFFFALVWTVYQNTGYRVENNKIKQEQERLLKIQEHTKYVECLKENKTSCYREMPKGCRL